MKKLKKKYIMILGILILLIILGILSQTGAINRIITRLTKGEQLKDISWETCSVDDENEIGQVLIKFQNENGIKKLTYNTEDGKTPLTVNANGKAEIAIDYKMKDGNSYKFAVEYRNGQTKDFSINYEIPRIQGNYKLDDGIYVYEPDLTEGFVKNKTRYLYMNDSGTLVPGNWITDEEPQNWYNYKEQKWANIYVENEGLDSYLVWIPRYAYKLDSQNQRSDVKFINVYNEYINPETGEKTEWSELKEQGYQVPEAFMFGITRIPGYWMSKYQLSELGSSYIIDYYLSASENSLNATNLKISTTKNIAKYTYAINGKIVNESESAADYQFANVGTDVKIINITALDADGAIIGSMTKELETVEVNKPELDGFDKDTTFYVYWDENGNEHNEIPISQDPPDGWYNYTYSKWANIVSRNNGIETYLVWIPRYQYKLNSTSQRSSVKFITGTGTDTTTGYQIPEAFTFNGKELTGYWMSKYQISSEESNEKLKVEMAAGDTYINIKEIQGTLVDEAKKANTELKIEYYLNGELKHTGNDTNEYYKYDGLELNKEYTINIIIRNSTTDAYIGAITNKVTTKIANEPDISAFDKNTTYYVRYNDDGTEKERKPLSEGAPSDWYDYSNSKWANIVTTANGTETFMVWIPRYEYMILSDRDNVNKQNRRTEVKFITGTSTETSTGYQIPEAFTFGGKELTGYWISKYQLSE